MKIVATNDNLDLLDTYDLGTDAAKKGPDQNRFNNDITTPSERQYMEQSDYVAKVVARAKHENEKEQREEKARLQREKLEVIEGSSR
jgi:hypothetical protein